MNAWLIPLVPIGAAVWCGAVWAQSESAPPPSATTTATNATASTVRYALESMIVDPRDIGLEATRTIDGLVINVKNPVKVIANDREQSNLVTSSMFRDKNLRFAALGMHSWLSVTYTITNEGGKQITLWLMEFDKPLNARRFGGWETQAKAEEGQNLDAEFKGSVFYQFLHGPILLKVTWPEPKTPGVDKIVSAYKVRMLTM